MTITFIIAPYVPDEWAKSGYSYTKPIGDFRIDQKQYQEGLQGRWSQIDLRTPANNRCVLGWELPPSRPDFAGLRGCLSSNGQIITIGTGPKESFLEFVLWHRSFVASENNLYLFGSGYEDNLQLKPDITQQEVVDYTGIVD